MAYMTDQLIIMHILDVYHPEIIHPISAYWSNTHKDTLILKLSNQLIEQCKNDVLHFNISQYQIIYNEKSYQFTREDLKSIFLKVIAHPINDEQLTIIKDNVIIYKVLLYTTDLL